MKQLIDEHQGAARAADPLRHGRRLRDRPRRRRLFAARRRSGTSPPLVANLLGYLVAMVTGYVLHSRLSFRGHGTPRQCRADAPRRFFIVILVSLGLNSLFVWHPDRAACWTAPGWWPVIPIAVRDPARHLLAQPAVGVRADGAHRLRPDGGARRAALVVSGAARHPRRADPAPDRPAARTRGSSRSAAAPATISPMLGAVRPGRRDRGRRRGARHRQRAPRPAGHGRAAARRCPACRTAPTT